MTIKKQLLISRHTGSITIEFITATLIVLSVIFIVLGVSYFYFAKVTISSVGYDALICSAERQPTVLCVKNAKKTLQQRLPFGKLDRLQVKASRGWFRTNINWTLYSDKKISYTKGLRY